MDSCDPATVPNRQKRGTTPKTCTMAEKRGSENAGKMKIMASSVGPIDDRYIRYISDYSQSPLIISIVDDLVNCSHKLPSGNLT